jgi:hypothetical protein
LLFGSIYVQNILVASKKKRKEKRKEKTNRSKRRLLVPVAEN